MYKRQDLCSTRRLSEERVTFCLTHSLNIENGIPSACDLDFNSLLTQAILENLSGKSVYMGNANVCSLEDGKLPTIFGDFDLSLIHISMMKMEMRFRSVLLQQRT